MAGSIAEAMMAARNVDQKAVQGSTQAARRIAMQSNVNDDDLRDQKMYEAYRMEMQQAGRPAVSFKQWQMMYRHSR